MAKRSAVLVMTVVLAFCLALAVEAGSVSASGKQTRGTPGRNGQLLGGEFEIPKGVTATIRSVSCNGDGFWIEGPVRKSFSKAEQAKGQTLGPGKYRALPNLKPGQNEAGVSLTLAW